jgi:hypothetical protein
MRRVIGVTQEVVSRARGIPRRWAVLLTLALSVSAGVAIVLAVHDTGRFQLDGDAATGTFVVATTGTDDWDKVCYAVVQKPVAQGGEGLTAAQAAARCGIATGPTSSTEVAWTAEANPSSSIFTGGGSKDPIDITQWAWKDAGGLPDKDNLQHGYGVRYSLAPSATCPGGGFPTCEVLYFGSDRFDNSGDAQQGVWFLQSKVTLGGAKSGGGTGFTGQHKDGDVLVISDFSNGGTVSTMKIFQWNHHCTATGKNDGDPLAPPPGDCADANLWQRASSDTANCATAGSADQFCGLVNPQDITLPWSFTDKSGTAGNGALIGEFFEGGINLSTLGLGGECFQSVLLETRSSTSTTATLKDFVLGQLGECGGALTTDVRLASSDLAANGVVAPGTPVHDTATITITGATAPDDATGTVDFSLCYSATAIPDCSTGGTAAGTGKTLTDTSSPANVKDGISGASSDEVNTAANPLAGGFYCFRAKATLTNYASPAEFTNTTTECFQVQLTSSVSTAQRWLPNDLATVAKTGGGAASGSVTFALYESGDCTGTAVGTFGPITLVGGQALSTNTSVYTTNKTVSWRVTFTSTDPNVIGSTSHCETSSISGLNNDTGS